MNENTIEFRIYKLKEPLIPGDEIELEFDFEIQKRGFTENNPMNESAYNGTCILHSTAEQIDYFPCIGFSSSVILQDDYDRKKYNLPPRPVNISLEDADNTKCYGNYNQCTYEAIISTCEDQTVVSNGDLIKTWTLNNRNYFHYKSDIPMDKEFVFASGKYKLASEKYKNITIEIYYHKKHYYNIKNLIEGVKKSLDYCSANFSPYPYNFLRIVEIPEEKTKVGARSQPSIFIWYENAGFTTDNRDPENVDNVFGICTHEMAHQWWAYVVYPAKAEGAFMLAETMAQYVEVMCLEKEYGKKMVRKYIDTEYERYLKYRKRDREGERPLMRAYDSQDYINYPKSTIVMYALQDYIGEDRVNIALKRVVDKFGNRDDIYATSLDAVNEFKAVTPDSLQYLITDLFEKVTLYENKAISARCEKLNNGQFKVNFVVNTAKFYADSIGAQIEAQLNDYIYIGVLGEDDEELYLQKHKFNIKQNEFEIIVDKKPIKAGIDPFAILIDRNRKDNLVKVEAVL